MSSLNRIIITIKSVFNVKQTMTQLAQYPLVFLTKIN